MPISNRALSAFLVATVTAEELEKPPCGMFPVETSLKPLKVFRPRCFWTWAPRFPLRSVRSEAMALPTRAKGRRMLLETHNVGGGSGWPFRRRSSSSSSLKYPNPRSRPSLKCVPNPS